MIKAEDLRIGDLVKINKNCSLKEGVISYITEIRTRGIFEIKDSVKVKPFDSDWEFGVWCCNIDPIPLTPEILEKNGWSKRHDSSSCDIYFKGKGAFHVELEQCIYNKQEGFRFVVGDGTYLFGNKIKHVHKLQHILWALGKDANLKI